MLSTRGTNFRKFDSQAARVTAAILPGKKSICQFCPVTQVHEVYDLLLFELLKTQFSCFLVAIILKNKHIFFIQMTETHD